MRHTSSQHVSYMEGMIDVPPRAATESSVEVSGVISMGHRRCRGHDKVEKTRKRAGRADPEMSSLSAALLGAEATVMAAVTEV